MNKQKIPLIFNNSKHNSYLKKSIITGCIISFLSTATAITAHANSNIKSIPILSPNTITQTQYNTTHTHFIKAKKMLKSSGLIVGKHIKHLNLSDEQKNSLKDIRAKYKKLYQSQSSPHNRNDIVEKTITLLKKDTIIRKDVHDINRIKLDIMRKKFQISTDMNYEIIQILNKEQRLKLAKKINERNKHKN